MIDHLIPLPENAGLAFIGEREWSPALISPVQADAFSATRNPAGRSNSDVLRSFVGKTGRRLHEHWQIDFPAHYTEQEAALHERPFALQKKRTGATAGSWWINPHAQMSLRHALARLDRFLATALDASEPAWFWLESDRLPDASLLVVARDDDFTHAVLASVAFTSWWHGHFQKHSPVRLIESFPFPWPPFAPLGSLTKAQQDLRSQAARAVLSGDVEQVNSTVAAAYDWTDAPDKDEIVRRLRLDERRDQSPR